MTLEQLEAAEFVSKVLEWTDLTAKQRFILEGLFGFCGTPATPKELAEELGVTVAHIYGQRNSALDKIRYKASLKNAFPRDPPPHPQRCIIFRREVSDQQARFRLMRANWLASQPEQPA